MQRSVFRAIFENRIPRRRRASNVLRPSVPHTATPVRLLSPGGRIENSPAVHCRVQRDIKQSPEGTAETIECHASILTPFFAQRFSRPFGTRGSFGLVPALKR